MPIPKKKKQRSKECPRCSSFRNKELNKAGSQKQISLQRTVSLVELFCLDCLLVYEQATEDPMVLICERCGKPKSHEDSIDICNTDGINESIHKACLRPGDLIKAVPIEEEEEWDD